MKILFCGKDDFSYHRTQVLLQGLQQTPGVVCHTHSLKKRNRAEGEELRERSKFYDWVLVPSFRHQDVRWVKQYASAPVVFDPLISTYLTKVEDYGHYYKAPHKLWVDYRSLHAADLLVADTEAMKDYYHRIFRVPAQKIGVAPVGFIRNDFAPHPFKEAGDTFVAGFYGSFVPQQGTLVIAEAARMLASENIRFDIIGTGAEYRLFTHFIAKHQLHNIRLLGWLPYEQLATTMADFDMALGIFGTSEKANRVIPDKLFHYAAMRKCIVTRSSKAITEIFSTGHNILTITPNGQSLADNIRLLRDNPDMREQLALKGWETIREGYREEAIAQKLLAFLEGK
jgi:glycosyltransferase involved in cell wall biosynthesis